MSRFLFFAAMTLAAALAVAFGTRHDAPAAPAGPSPATQAPAGGEQVHPDPQAPALMLRRNAQGQFHLTGEVNGQSVPFLVDTGADMLALTVEDAESLGLDFNPDQFRPIGQSASGTAYGAIVTLDTLVVAGTEFREVPAVVLDGLDTNLLGQSVLRRLGGIQLTGDRMVIQPAR